MYASEQLQLAGQIATVTVPVAMYFLVLGLLNSRPNPLVLSARGDFLLLAAAVSPIFVLPMLSWLGVSVLTVGGTLSVLVSIVAILSPPGGGWVIYNLSPTQARAVIESAIRSLGLDAKPTVRGYDLTDRPGRVRVSAFPLLRNTSIRLIDVDDELARRFEAALTERVAAVTCQVSPMAAAMLTVAAVMLAIPAALTAGRAVEIVRILTDLLG